MTTIINWIKSWFKGGTPAVADEHCPHCLGLGYDYSSLHCSCLREKK